MEDSREGIFVPLDKAQLEMLECFANELKMSAGDLLRSAAECLYCLERNELLNHLLKKLAEGSDDAQWAQSMREIDESQKRVRELLDSHPVK